MKCYRCNLWPCECRDSIALICGDNCDVMGQLPKESVDLVVTSPPYDDLRTYGGHSWDFYGVAWQLKRLLKPGGVIVWVVGDSTKDGSESGSSMRQALHFQSLGLNLHDTMVWNQQDSSMPDSVRYWDSWEFMFVVSKGRPSSITQLRDKPNRKAGVSNGSGKKRIGSGETELKRWEGNYAEYGVRYNVWDCGSVKTRPLLHPAPFPESLARDHILSWSNEGDTVLDPFNGSGTTTKMAKATGRKAIGIEVNEEYLAIQVNRLRQEVLQFSEDAT
jgi:DNA modification methylase